jgi:hypothetical protein
MTTSERSRKKRQERKIEALRISAERRIRHLEERMKALTDRYGRWGGERGWELRRLQEKLEMARADRHEAVLLEKNNKNKEPKDEQRRKSEIFRA